MDESCAGVARLPVLGVQLDFMKVESANVLPANS
jgi:hypothetical protein